MSEKLNLSDELNSAADSARSRKRKYRAQINRETTVLYEGKLGKVVIPHSMRAAIFWGRDTKWCTAAAISRNRYQTYTETSPLVTFLPVNNSKFQIHEAVCFTASNNKIPLEWGPKALVEKVLEKYPGLEPYLIDPRFHNQLMDYNQILQILEEDDMPERIVLLEEEGQTHEKILEAVQKNGDALSQADPELVDRDIVIAALLTNRSSIRHADMKWRNDLDIMMEAIIWDFCNARYTGDELKENPKYQEFIEQFKDDTPEIAIALPATKENEQIVARMVAADGMLLEQAYDYQGNREIVLLAVQENGKAAHYMDKGFLNDIEIVSTAILTSLGVVDIIPYSIWDAIPAEIKKQAWENEIKDSWWKISLANDCGIELSPQRELDILMDAKRLSPLSAIEQNLHLFPSLRQGAYEGNMSIETAVSLLESKGAKTGAKRFAQTRDGIGMNPC